jgi:hypothetical protein
VSRHSYDDGTDASASNRLAIQHSDLLLQQRSANWTPDYGCLSSLMSHTLQSSKAEVLLAVDLYNRSVNERQLEAFVVHMNLGWTKLLQARTDASTYSGDATAEHSRGFQWAHPISDIISALIGAGLHILRLNEAKPFRGGSHREWRRSSKRVPADGSLIGPTVGA